MSQTIVRPRTDFGLMRRVLLALLVAGCGGATPTPQIVYVTPPPTVAPTTAPATPSPTPEPTVATHDLTVKTVVKGQPFGELQTLIGLNDVLCASRGPYSDVGTGMQAVVQDPGGTVIGFATFDTAGQTTRAEPGPVGPVPYECTFTTIVPDVPEAASYGIEVGDRGVVRFSLAELREAHWTAVLTLGD